MCLLLRSCDTAKSSCEPGYVVCNPIAFLNPSHPMSWHSRLQETKAGLAGTRCIHLLFRLHQVLGVRDDLRVPFVLRWRQRGYTSDHTRTKPNRPRQGICNSSHSPRIQDRPGTLRTITWLNIILKSFKNPPDGTQDNEATTFLAPKTTQGQLSAVPSVTDQREGLLRGAQKSRATDLAVARALVQGTGRKRWIESIDFELDRSPGRPVLSSPCSRREPGRATDPAGCG